MYPTVNVSDAKAHIDHIISNNDSIIFLFHKIEPDTNIEQTNYPIDKFQEIVNYVSEKSRLGELDVLTWSEYCSKE